MSFFKYIGKFYIDVDIALNFSFYICVYLDILNITYIDFS